MVSYLDNFLMFLKQDLYGIKADHANFSNNYISGTLLKMYR